LNGPVMTIRKFPEPITMEKLIGFGTVTPEAAEFIKTLVRARYNIFVSGGTSSGKTTLLNALSAFIPREERIITIEDSAELQINHIPNIVRMETRDVNTEGKGSIDMSMLIKASLRMRPDRIIVGEVRDKSASDMLAAFDTGHDGSLSTGHANSAADMLTRLESMVLMGLDIPLDAVRHQIGAAIDILIHLERLPDRSRRIVEISELNGYHDGHYEISRIFSYSTEEKRLIKTGELKNRYKLERAGLRA
ncbi:MAG: ATPase, T2SS/T4P/T4SS family, partial [Eubacteriales bacterium]|nr:ATPase, T2SS/T4P/T4SS family [Eubacteriales bacterium]